MAQGLKFNIELNVDNKDAGTRVEQLRAELEELNGKTIGIEIGDAEAKLKLRELQIELKEVAQQGRTIEMRVAADEALAKIAALKAEMASLDRKEVKVDVDTKQALSDVLTLKVALMALAPAVVPLAAVTAGAMGALGIGAVAGVAAAGALKLGFGGVSDAVKELGTSQQKSASTAAQTAAQQISSANSIANAEDSLRHAIDQVAVARDTASHNITMALQREGNAEQSLGDAQRAELKAQTDLTQARVDAQRALQDMAFAGADNALAVRRAQLDLQRAQFELAQMQPGDVRLPTQQLTVDEDKQHLLELQTQTQRLAADKTTADAKGIEGSKQVVAAQDALTAAKERTGNAEQALGNAVVDVTRAQADGARSIAQAQQAIVTATRSLADAHAQAAAQAASQAAQTQQLNQALNKLSPAGQQFAEFIHSTMGPRVKELQATAQAGLLPGVEQGLKNLMPIWPEINGLVDAFSRSLGDLAARAGAALNSPFWRNFIDFVKGEAGPNLRIFGSVLGNLATAGAAILEAFKPVWDQMGQGIERWSTKFAEASKNLSANPAFQNFIAYVKENGPLVGDTLGNLVKLAVRIGEAMAPWGSITLVVVDATAKLLNLIPQGTMDWLAPTILGIVLAWKAWNATAIISEAVMPVLTAETWSLNAAFMANPIGIVIGVLAGLVVGVIYAYNHFQTFRDIVNGAWNIIKDVSSFTWNNILKPIFDGFVWALNLVGQAFGGVVNWVRDNWGAIRDLAKAPIQFVIDVVYNNGILPVWNGIASVFGLHQLGPVHLATGGVLPGYAPGRDSVPAMLSPGEGVLIPEAVQGLGPGFVHWANRTFSNGRVTGGPGFADGGIVGDIAGIFTDPLGTLKRIFGGPLNDSARTPGTGQLTEAVKGLPMAVINAAVDKAKALVKSAMDAGIGFFGGTSGVEQWSQVTLQALAIMSQPSSLLATTLRRMNQESGGNPTAVNRTDINWQHGTPSVGLMQVIGPTYAANRVVDRPPYLYGVSVDPLSNITSSMHYAIGRYGSLPAAYNQAGGYANGGIVTSPTLAHIGEAGPEAVVPLTRPGRARQVMAAAGIGGPAVHIDQVHVHDAVDVDLLAQRLAFSTKAAGF